ncbi:MAG: hypothetical protein Q4G44_02630 [Alcaligenaceae bacterium]|nr:hypothetical protein [Alcaligenaceae bacterium]
MTKFHRLVIGVLCFFMSHMLYAQRWNAAPTTPPSQEVQKFFYGSLLSHQVYIQLNFAADGQITGAVGSDEYTNLAQTVPFTAQQSDQGLQVSFAEDPPAVGKASDWLLDKAWSLESNGNQEVLYIPMMARNYETSTWEETIFEYPCVDDNLQSIVITPQMPEDAPELPPYRWSSAAIDSSEGGNTHALLIEPLNTQRKGVLIQREGSMFVEAVIGHHVVLSLGTGVVLDLEVIDLALLQSTRLKNVSLLNEITVDPNRGGFSFYNYAGDMPIVVWNAATRVWESDTDIPETLFNDDFHRVVEQLPERWNGLKLAVMQKVHVDLETLATEFLDEYQWFYIE